jgi:endonuclease I
MKNKLFLSLITALLLTGCTMGGGSTSDVPPPPIEDPDGTVYGYQYYGGYYGELTWSNGEDLKQKLYNIISKDKKDIKYEGNWEVNKTADQSLYDYDYVDVLYSDTNELKTATYSSGSGWQREHAFPASLMTGFLSGEAVGTHGGRATDFHNLFATNNSGNSSRGNKNFGYADKKDESYQDKGSYEFDSNTFEPSDFDKGRVARALFYMGVMYSVEEKQNVKVKLNYNAADQQSTGSKSTTVTIPMTYKPLQLVEEETTYSKETYTNYYYQSNENCKNLVKKYGAGPEGYAKYSQANCDYAIGNLSTLLEWNGYTVDYLEYQHNERVYKGSNLSQGNRNPFVDYPQLAQYVYGSKKNEGGDLALLKPTEFDLKVYDDEIAYYAIKNAKREFASGEKFDTSSFTLVGVKGNLSTVNATLDNFEPYTFTANDAKNGNKTLTIRTPINEISLNVKVKAGQNVDPGGGGNGDTPEPNPSGDYESCSYKYNIQGSKAGADFNGFVKGNNIDLGGTTWNVDWSNSNGKIGSNNTTYGLAFGVASNNQTMNELIFKTVDAINVNAVYFSGSCASGKTINYTIKVGDQVWLSGTISRNSSTTGPEIVGGFKSTPINGQIQIIINGSGATSGAIYMKSLAYNAI